MKRVVILGAVVLAAIAAWTGAWLWGASWINSQAKALEVADGVSTPRVTCGDFGVGGFPFRFTITCTDASVEMGDVSVAIPQMRAVVAAYNPMHILLFAQSPVTTEDAFTGQKRRFDFASMEASARLSGWRLARVSVAVEAPVLSDTVLEDILIGRADRAEAHLVDLPNAEGTATALVTLGAFAEVTGLSAPGFEIAAGHTNFEAKISGLPDDVRAMGEPELLQRWAATGGQIELVGFKGEDGERHFEVSGNGGLDRAGRVNGQVRIASKGLVEGVEDQVPEALRGLILGAPAEDGSYSQTLNINAGVVFSGLIPTMIIPPLFEDAPQAPAD